MTDPNEKAVETSLAIEDIVEQCQIAGVDFFNKEERAEILERLADLYIEDRIEYEIQRNNQRRCQTTAPNSRPPVPPNIAIKVPLV